ncbi:flagellar biosynthesis anti-sigma factor FlgM [Legionella massiliensis]|uniref:Negative regulator of flagellin synthesis n=1 Tax=Legionella massiliensis TaxID=1034943 RepID=A0A078L1G8_9GAMM|nr:flagellar biosynthesis anti-sigma factor FlgM [Legionella massiliensis]CDZ79046.1 flagellar biosynthesis anti-sigma factor FlgM [Legionella massiliensis]CEE14784.1 Anti-sigma-28 factor, FlgM [Legionella massiliensis]
MSVIESNVMVNPLNDSSNFKRIDVDNRTQRQQTVAPGQSTDESNQVSLSDTSKQMNALKEFIQNIPDVNKARIEFLKEELASGRYRILSDQVAAKMFADIEIA